MKKFSSYIQEKKNAFLEEAENFVQFACEWLELDEPPAIYLSDNKKHAVAQKSFGGYSPSDKDIRVNIAERHKVDVFRTLAHELVHYRQDIDGRLDEDSGQTGSEIENEANAVAGIIMREYARATNGAIFEEYEVEIQEQEFLAEADRENSPSKTYTRVIGYQKNGYQNNPVSFHGKKSSRPRTYRETDPLTKREMTRWSLRRLRDESIPKRSHAKLDREQAKQAIIDNPQKPKKGLTEGYFNHPAAVTPKRNREDGAYDVYVNKTMIKSHNNLGAAKDTVRDYLRVHPEANPTIFGAKGTRHSLDKTTGRWVKK